MNARYSSRGPSAPSLTAASYGRRVAAFLIDGFLSWVLLVPFVAPWYLDVLDAARRTAAGDVGVVAPAPPVAVGLGILLAFVLGIVQWWLGGTRGYTIGKRLVRIRVLDELTGQPVGMGRFLLRQIVLGATGGILVGLLSPLFDSSGRLRGWHDRAASTAVTEAPADDAGRRAERVARSSEEMVPPPPGGPQPTVAAVPFAVPSPPGASAPVPAPVPVPAAPPVPAPAPATTSAHAPVPPPPSPRSGVPPLPAYLGEPQTTAPTHASVPVPQPPVPQPVPVPQPASLPVPLPPPPVPVAPSPVPPPPGPVEQPAPLAQHVDAQPVPAAAAPVQPASVPVPAPAPQVSPDAPGSGASASTAPTAAVPAPDTGVITAVPHFGYAAPQAPAGHAPATPPAAPPVADAAAARLAPSEPYVELDDETEMTRLRTDSPRDRGATAYIPPSALLRISDGTEMTITDTVLVGRNPAPAQEESIGQLVRVQDPGRSVSKTHLLVGVDADGVWVVDRGSTNGTVVTLTDGQQIICAEHQVVRLPEGATVTFGDYSASFVHRND